MQDRFTKLVDARVIIDGKNKKATTTDDEPKSYSKIRSINN